MQVAMCPVCGTERDARYLPSPKTPAYLECECCEISWPCCPTCGTLKAARDPQNQEQMRCLLCSCEFPAPAVQDRKTPLDAVQVALLVRVGEGTESLFPGLRSKNRLEEESSRARKRPIEVSDREYIEHELKRFLVVRRLVDWLDTESESDPDATPVPPPVGWIEAKLIADNIHVGRLSRRIRLKKAAQLYRILAHTMRSSAQGQSDFWHSDDYFTVRLGEHSWHLSEMCAQVIEMLHEHAKRGTEEIHQATILVRIGSNQKRLRDLFKRHKDAWDHLITRGRRKGTFRLKPKID